MKTLGAETVGVQEAANLMNVHANRVKKMIQEGTIPAAKIGRAYVMLKRDVLNYVEQEVVRQTASRIGMTAKMAA